MQDAQARAAQAFAATDPPVVFCRWSEPLEARRDLRAALLFQPLEPAELLQLPLQDVAECRQVPDIQRRVVEKLRSQRALGPVGLLAILVERDAEMLIQ